MKVINPTINSCRFFKDSLFKKMPRIHVKDVQSLIKVCYDLKAHPHIVELTIESVYCIDHPEEFLYFLKLCQLGCFRNLEESQEFILASKNL